MTKLITTAVVLCALLLAVAVRADAPRAAGRGTASARSLPYVEGQVRQYRSETWHWQRLMGVRRTPSSGTGLRSPDRTYRVWVRNLWRRRAVTVRRKAQHPPHRRQWLCIHRFEGHWAANTGNGYYGGLQMDLTFQRRYGRWLLRRKGTADNWTPLEQMWIAERAHRTGRGFYPWPNTARWCGLI